MLCNNYVNAYNSGRNVFYVFLPQRAVADFFNMYIIEDILLYKYYTQICNITNISN